MVIGRRSVVVKVRAARGILGIEVGVRAMEAGLNRLGVPLGIIVGVLVVIDWCWGVIWNERVLGRLAMGIVRIVLPLVGHGTNEGAETKSAR